MKKLFTQFSFPGGISSHVAPTTPGSIHEGGELGYSLSHAFGAAFDNPGPDRGLRGRRRRGRDRPAGHRLALQQVPQPGRATARCCRSCISMATRSPTRPCWPASSHEELDQFLRGCGWEPLLRRRRRPRAHAPADGRRRWTSRSRTSTPSSTSARARATAPAAALADDRAALARRAGPGRRSSTACRSKARSARTRCRCCVDEAHPGHLEQLEAWMRSYKPEELFDETGRLLPELADAGPDGRRGAWAPTRTPTAACCCSDLRCPTSATTRWRCPRPGAVDAEDTRVLGDFLRDVIDAQRRARNFRLFGPDETAVQPAGRRLRGHRSAVGGPRPRRPTKSPRAATGACWKMLSEHQCEGWLEGYLLTGRHGLFNCYEAFIHIVDSMFNQHAKWLKVTAQHALAPRHRLAELPAHLARVAAGPQRLHPPGSRLPRPRRQQESRHRARLPAARRQLPAVGGRPLPAQPPLRQRDRRRQARRCRSGWTWTPAVVHCTEGIGIWEWASNDQGGEPDVVLACCGDIPTLEVLAAVSILRDTPARAEDPRGQRRRSDEAAARQRAPARPVRRATTTRSSPPTSTSSSPSTATPR